MFQRTGAIWWLNSFKIRRCRLSGPGALKGFNPGWGGGTPLYKLYRYVPPQRVWFSSRFGLKTGIDFDHYGLKSGMVFKGTTGAYKRICFLLFVQKLYLLFSLFSFQSLFIVKRFRFSDCQHNYQTCFL